VTNIFGLKLLWKGLEDVPELSVSILHLLFWRYIARKVLFACCSNANRLLTAYYILGTELPGRTSWFIPPPS
jgi:hypothetical protein